MRQFPKAVPTFCLIVGGFLKKIDMLQLTGLPCKEKWCGYQHFVRLMKDSV